MADSTTPQTPTMPPATAPTPTPTVTPAPALAPATANTTVPPAQTQSIDATTLGSPTVSTSQLPQQPAYTPPPIPDLSTITAAGSAPTASQPKYDAIEGEEADLTEKLGGQSADYNNLTNAYGVPNLMSTANDLTANIQQIQAQRDANLQQLSAASKGYGIGAYLDFQNKMTDGELAAKQSAYAATLATINGQLSTAQTYITNAIKNKYDPINNQIAALKDQADLVSTTLNSEQAKQLAVMQAQLTDRTNAIAANKAIATTMLEKIATAAANSVNPAPAYIVTQAQQAALGDNPASALAIISPYLTDPNAAAAEIADIRSKNASAADSEADAAYKVAETKQIGNTSPTGGAVGTTGSPTVDATASGYTSQPVVGQYTQADIDQKALAYITSGTQPPIGRTGAAGQLNAAVSNRMAEMDPTGNLAANKTQLKALSSSLSQQTEYLNTAQRSISNAEAGFQQVVTAFQGKVDTTQYPSINAAVNAVKGQLAPGDISAYQAGLAEVANEYTQVFSRGGTATDAVRAKASSIANGDLSISDLQEVLNEVQAQGQIVITGSQNQVKSIQDQINQIAQPGGSSTSSGNTVTVNGTNYTVGQVYQDASGTKWTVDASGNWTKQ